MKILALDIGKFKTMCCFYDSKTRKFKFDNLVTDQKFFEVLFKESSCDLVVMEACGPSGWINDLAVAAGHNTLVCSTNEDAWKWMNVKRKTDKDDALKLARMAAMGELKAVHMPSASHREFRSLVKYRKTLDNRINKCKCTIRAWFVNHGITIPKGEAAWHTGREIINSYRKPFAECTPNEFWKAEMDTELTQLDSLTEQLGTITKKLDEVGKNDPRIVLVQTIPGVGPRTAEIIVACIDDATRFENGRQVSAYFGLVPRKFQSGETNRDGRITKRGNPLARTILTECAWASLRYNPWASHIYHRICGKQKTRKKKAAIALARKIVVIAWAMLRDGKDWNPQIMIETTEQHGKIAPELKKELLEMKPKECRHKRKNRRISEERAAARVAAANSAGEKAPKEKRSSSDATAKVKTSANQTATKTKAEATATKASPTKKAPANSTSTKTARSTKTTKPRLKAPIQRRARKRETLADAVASAT
jgi:transposase